MAMSQAQVKQRARELGVDVGGAAGRRGLRELAEASADPKAAAIDAVVRGTVAITAGPALGSKVKQRAATVSCFPAVATLALGGGGGWGELMVQRGATVPRVIYWYGCGWRSWDRQKM
jgi:hypothetical protein